MIPARWQGLDARAPRFERFLQEIFGDRPDAERTNLLAFLQRALGYGITGNVEEHIFLMLYGEEGRNGKDTLMETLQHVLGPVSGAVSNDVLIASGKLTSPGSAKSYLCSLQGKRITWASETSKGARFDVGQVKYLTGGGEISARQLYGRDYTFAPSHLLLLLTNHKPHADAGDAAFWNRLCPIIFDLRFVEQPQAHNERQRDTGLLRALKTEASGILAWLVRGCLAWQQHGLDIPECILQARQAYRGEEDTLQEFLQECCVLVPQARARAGKLYERYTAWIKENNLRALNGRAFGLEMKKRFACEKDRKGVFYQGVGVLVADETGDLFAEACEGSCSTDQNAMSQPEKRDYPLFESSSCEGCAGTFHNLTQVQNRPFVRESYGNTLHTLHTRVEKNHTQPALEKAGSPPVKSHVTLHTTDQAQPFPFPRERLYVRTSLGIVGYLTHNDRPGCRAVRGLLDGPNSETFTSAPLQHITWEEARAWWFAQPPEGVASKKGSTSDL